MRIRYFDKITRSRYMTYEDGSTEVPEYKGVRAIRAGMAEAVEGRSTPISMPDSMLVDTPMRREKMDFGKLGKDDYDPYLTPICWVQDYGRTGSGVGGAEFSNAQVIKVGRELGFDIKVVTDRDKGVNKKTDGEMVRAGFSGKAKRWLADAKVIILNNLSGFDSLQTQELLILAFEMNHPIVRYEHDYGFCRRRTSLNCGGNLDTCVMDERGHEDKVNDAVRQSMPLCRLRHIETMRQLFNAAILNVFISPQQAEIHRKVLGDVIEPCFLLTPPIDVNHFKPVPKATREKNTVVSMTGKIHHWVKGEGNLLRHIEEHPEYKYTIHSEQNADSAAKFGKFGDRVKYLPPVGYDKLPEVYSRHEYTIHLPAGWEPSGRTVWEGLLCGTKQITNDRVGSMQMDIPKSRDKARETIKTGPYRFWREIERRI